MPTTELPFRFDPRFRRLLVLAGVTERRASVVVDDDRFSARFGPWSVSSARDDVVGAEITGPYTWYKAVGPRLSAADRGLTFGTNAERGVCIRFRRPVPGLDPLGVLRHPALTVTVADCERLRDLLSS